MIMIVRSLAVCAAALGLALASAQAHANLLVPGASGIPPDVFATSPLVGTTILADTGVQTQTASSGLATTTANGEAWVVKGYSENPFGAGDLTFVYQVKLVSGVDSDGFTPAIIERLTMASFGSFLTDAGSFLQAIGQKVPLTMDRSGAGSFGNIIGVNFPSPVDNLNVGDTTALIIINTNATGYTAGTFTAQDGLTVNFVGFSPTVAPEPATMAMALSAVPFLGLAAWRRRRKAV